MPRALFKCTWLVALKHVFPQIVVFLDVLAPEWLTVYLEAFVAPFKTLDLVARGQITILD